MSRLNCFHHFPCKKNLCGIWRQNYRFLITWEPLSFLQFSEKKLSTWVRVCIECGERKTFEFSKYFRAWSLFRRHHPSCCETNLEFKCCCWGSKVKVALGCFSESWGRGRHCLSHFDIVICIYCVMLAHLEFWPVLDEHWVYYNKCLKCVLWLNIFRYHSFSWAKVFMSVYKSKVGDIFFLYKIYMKKK